MGGGEATRFAGQRATNDMWPDTGDIDFGHMGDSIQALCDPSTQIQDIDDVCPVILSAPDQSRGKAKERGWNGKKRQQEVFQWAEQDTG